MKTSHMTNYGSIISASDLHCHGISDRRESGLPLGNGRMGSLLFVTPTSIRFQINRVDVYANGCATNSFPGIDSDYASGCGFIDIDFIDYGDDIFTEEDAKQHLNIYDGYAALQGKDIEVKAFVLSGQDTLAVEVTDKRNHSSPVRAALRVLRYTSQYDKG